jgi:hypothetical protein
VGLLSMGLWSWARDVVAERGEHAPVPIHLERAREGDGYVLRLGVRAGFGGQETARIPVFKRINPAPHPILKEIHYCEVAGQTLEAANPYALMEKVAMLLDGIAPARTLPLAYFRVPDMDYELPVYEDDGQIVSPVVGGPNLKADDFAGIRRHVCRYLVSTGYVSDQEQVSVGVLRPRDLRLVTPAAVFRSIADPELWIPSVEGVSAEGPVIGVLESAARIARPERRRAGAGPAAEDQAPAAPDVLSLLRALRVELERGRRAAVDVEAVYASEVRPEIWADAERRALDEGMQLVAYLSDDEGTRLELPIRHTGAGDVACALEDRCINAFVANDEQALAAAVGRHLHAEGFLRFATEVEIHTAERPRAERLEADTIWTFGDDREAVAHTGPEEVPQP